MLKTRVTIEKSPSKVRVDETDGGASRKSTVSKVSHTLSVALAERLEEFAFFQRVSESAVIEHSLASFFAQSEDDMILGDLLRREGAGRRRKS
jgi:hypothetical protein